MTAGLPDRAARHVLLGGPSKFKFACKQEDYRDGGLLTYLLMLLGGPRSKYLCWSSIFQSAVGGTVKRAYLLTDLLDGPSKSVGTVARGEGLLTYSLTQSLTHLLGADRQSAHHKHRLTYLRTCSLTRRRLPISSPQASSSRSSVSAWTWVSAYVSKQLSAR